LTDKLIDGISNNLTLFLAENLGDSGQFVALAFC